jgi:para-nitrobenzyl esterase
MLKHRISATAVGMLASIVMALPATAAAQADDKIVRIDSGTIEGAVSGDVVSFKGIPYAAPPMGALRWGAPQPVTPWRSVRPATKYGLDCMQKPIPGDAA